jgi:hypothetical protein
VVPVAAAGRGDGGGRGWSGVLVLRLAASYELTCSPLHSIRHPSCVAGWAAANGEWALGLAGPVVTARSVNQ